MSPRRSTLSLNQKLTLAIALFAVIVAILTAFFSGHDWFTPADSSSQENTQTSTAEVLSIAEPISAPVDLSMSVFSAKFPFASTGIIVHEGERLTITATGNWDCGRGALIGPEGYADEEYADHVFPNAPACALIGAISPDPLTEDFDQYFLVGAEGSWIAPITGKLYLGCNDASGRFADNPTDSKVEVHTIVGK